MVLFPVETWPKVLMRKVRKGVDAVLVCIAGGTLDSGDLTLEEGESFESLFGKMRSMKGYIFV